SPCHELCDAEQVVHRGVGAEELSGLPERMCPVGYRRLRLRLALRLTRTLEDHCLGGLLALVDVCLKDSQSEGREPELGDLPAGGQRRPRIEEADRKSTCLNSSHVSISYAVFCLKKKNDRRDLRRPNDLRN